MQTIWFCVAFLAGFQGETPQQEDDLKKRVEKLEKKVGGLEEENELLKLRLELQEERDDPGAGAEQESPLNILNPRITVFGNFLYRLDDRTLINDDGDAFDDTANLRETEVDFRAAVDPYADGLLIVAWEAEVPGEYEAAVEEGYVTIKKIPLSLLEEPPLGMQWKVGRFRTEIGRSNRLHLHDLPQPDRPLVVEELFGEEGEIGDGASVGLILPSIADVFFDATLQAFHTGGDWAAVVNVRGYSEIINENHSIDASYVFHYEDLGFTEIHSLDLLYGWRPARGGTGRSVTVGGQIFYHNNKATSPHGYYTWGQYQINRWWFAGVRWEATETSADDRKATRRLTPYVSWYFTEFLRLRLGWEHTWSDDPAVDHLDTLLVEVNVVFGSHPPEPFWVNR